MQNILEANFEGIEPHINRITFVSQEHKLFNEKDEFILIESIFHEASLTNTH